MYNYLSATIEGVQLEGQKKGQPNKVQRKQSTFNLLNTRPQETCIGGHLKQEIVNWVERGEQLDVTLNHLLISSTHFERFYSRTIKSLT